MATASFPFAIYFFELTEWNESWHIPELKELRVKKDVGETMTSAEDRIITVSGNSGSGVYNNNYEKMT